MALQEKDLIEINGGGYKLTIGIIVAGVISFVIGVIDGYLRPLSCNK